MAIITHNCEVSLPVRSCARGSPLAWLVNSPHDRLARRLDDDEVRKLQCYSVGDTYFFCRSRWWPGLHSCERMCAHSGAHLVHRSYPLN